eukprot:366417-Chlamydomonas_euryale.AAC.33
MNAVNSTPRRARETRHRAIASQPQNWSQSRSRRQQTEQTPSGAPCAGAPAFPFELFGCDAAVAAGRTGEGRRARSRAGQPIGQLQRRCAARAGADAHATYECCGRASADELTERGTVAAADISSCHDSRRPACMGDRDGRPDSAELARPNMGNEIGRSVGTLRGP